MAARSERGVVVLNRRGELVPVPVRRAVGRAVTWSPDERWTAVAAGRHVAFFRTRGETVAGEEPFVQAPIEAADLIWR